MFYLTQHWLLCLELKLSTGSITKNNTQLMMLFHLGFCTSRTFMYVDAPSKLFPYVCSHDMLGEKPVLLREISMPVLVFLARNWEIF